MGTTETEDTVTPRCSLAAAGMQSWCRVMSGHPWGCCFVVPRPQECMGVSYTPVARVL